MKADRVHLIVAIHDHQPVGNFEHVFAQAYDQSYRPFLECLARHPTVRLALHHTGPLLEWMAAHRPGYLRDLRALVVGGQVEILGGGFYEPMLSVLPEEDAIGQILMMSDFCEAHLGARPEGMWLAERVWEPDLPRVMAAAGVRFTLADDTHFRYAGLLDRRLHGYYQTDKAGASVGVFPIDKGLRYHIPFQAPEACLAYLEGARGESPSPDLPPALTYGDDGEKFGLWPGTYEWCWEKRWLERWFEQLEAASEWLLTLPPGDYYRRFPSSGRIYLPTASYEEMTEWALPAEAGAALEELKHEVAARGRAEAFRPFLRGGIWPNFFVKYPEANRLHKKMIRVSAKVAAAGGAGRQALYRGQCNCAYWHGLFGGLYLNYLRGALYRNLIEAECEADAALDRHQQRLEQTDHDGDGALELLFENEAINAYFAPRQGGALFELDCRPTRMQVTDVLARHPETYHRKVAGAAAPGEPESGAVASIHDRVVAKEAGLERLLIYDRHPRLCFVDRPLRAAAGPIDLWGGCPDSADFAGRPYAVLEASDRHLLLAREGHVLGAPLALRKRFEIDGDQILARYQVSAQGAPLRFRLAVDFVLTLLAGDAPDRYLRIDGARFEGDRLGGRGQRQGASQIELIDEWSRTRICLTSTEPAGSPAATLWWAPLETVSQSEDGFERTYQGTQIAWVRDLTLGAGESACFELSLRVHAIAPDPDPDPDPPRPRRGDR